LTGDGSRLEQGSVVEINGKEHRLHLKITDTCWQLEQSRTGRIVEFEQNDLLRMIVDHSLTFLGNAPLPNPQTATSPLSPQDHKIAVYRRTYVIAVLHLPNTRKPFERAINDVWKRETDPAKREAPSWTSVYHWKKRYILAKEDYRALVPNTQGKGNRESRYPSIVTGLCTQSIEAKYLRRECSSQQGTLEDAVLRVMNENAMRPACDALPLPTLRLIRRLIDNLDAFDKYSAQKGRDAARKMFRSL
jgi:putative transposase